MKSDSIQSNKIVRVRSFVIFLIFFMILTFYFLPKMDYIQNERCNDVPIQNNFQRLNINLTSGVYHPTEASSSLCSDEMLDASLVMDHDLFYYQRTVCNDSIDLDSKFELKPFDSFKGSPSLCGSLSKHSPEIMGTCNNMSPPKGKKAPCCKTVMFVGMCGKWASVLRKFPFKLTCPKLGCTVVVDHVAKSKMIAAADLVILTHIGGYMSHTVWEELLKNKHDKQRWVFSTIESPIYVRGLLPPWVLRNVTYDFADTYYSDTDVSTPYGYYEPFRIGLPKISWNFREHVKGKNKLISWTASHCETSQWDRTKFARDLAKILPVDTYGKCGKLSVCKDTWSDKCVSEFDNLMKTYKFSLSLENSCCREYITEKFWKMLDLGNVPVVIGPPIEDFEHLAPPGSFIHADQFSSMEDLADYLRYLDQNDTAYMEYFTWKTKGRVFSDTTPDHYKRAVSDDTICQLIKILLEETQDDKVDVPRRRYDVYSSLWQGRCETCGHHEWLKKFEFPPEHKRKSSSLWA